jgi:hypothetical protein
MFVSWPPRLAFGSSITSTPRKAAAIENGIGKSSRTTAVAVAGRKRAPTASLARPRMPRAAATGPRLSSTAHPKTRADSARLPLGRLAAVMAPSCWLLMAFVPYWLWRKYSASPKITRFQATHRPMPKSAIRPSSRRMPSISSRRCPARQEKTATVPMSRIASAQPS